MEIKKEGSNKVTVVANRKIDITNSQDLKEELLNLIQQGYTEITIDFDQVESVDSSGLGKLLLIHKRLKERNGALKIINLNNDYVKKMFSMIHLNK
ncbi:MAG: STAS domain-containing protein, partial [Bacillota bacterium]